MQHPVGNAGNRAVVGDDHQRGAALAVDPHQRFEHADAGRAVERAGRLVAEQHFGLLGDGAGDGDPLLLPARKLGRIMRGALCQPDQFERG